MFGCHWLGTPGWDRSQPRVTVQTLCTALPASTAQRGAAQRTGSQRPRAGSSRGRRRHHGEEVRRPPGPGNLGGGGEWLSPRPGSPIAGPQGAKGGHECPGEAERPGGEPGVGAGRQSSEAAGIEQGWRHGSRKGTRVVRCSLLGKGAGVFMRARAH